jgi:hypothetical protein
MKTTGMVTRFTGSGGWPSGSRAAVLYPRRAKALLVPDVPGVYRVCLVVSDGFMNSAPCAASITVIGVRK